MHYPNLYLVSADSGNVDLLDRRGPASGNRHGPGSEQQHLDGLRRSSTRCVSVKVAPRALLISLSLWERAGVRETIMVPTTDIFRGGVGAMIVRVESFRSASFRRHRDVPPVSVVLAFENNVIGEPSMRRHKIPQFRGVEVLLNASRSVGAI